jgi:hypothetical protein
MPETPIVFSHHGRSRNGADYRDYFQPFVDELDFVVVAPEFTDAAYPGRVWYNAGHMRDVDGSVMPPESCTYAVIPRLYVALQTGGFAAREHYAVFGHSAGAQFVHRQLTFGYAGEVAIAISANAGTYSMPDPHTPFPCGIDGTDAKFPSLLSFPLTIMAGIADNNADEPFVPGDPGSLPQGAHRHERAHRYFAKGQAVAARLGIPCAWLLIEVPGVAHDGKRMAEAAAPVLAAALHR